MQQSALPFQTPELTNLTYGIEDNTLSYDIHRMDTSL